MTKISMNDFKIRGFNLCESLLRHSPEELCEFLNRMKSLNLNTIIIHYDYGWKRYQKLLIKECSRLGIEITLMVFGPRTFFSYVDYDKKWFAKKSGGTTPFLDKLECETHPCCHEEDALLGFAEGAEIWLKSLPPEIKRVHLRAADGLMFCECPKCRLLPEAERWRPFIEIFAEVIKKAAPEIKFETDLYIKRYEIPDNTAAFDEMSRIMFDTFYRHPFFPIGSNDDVANAFVMKYAASSVGNTDSATPNAYYLKRLQEWCNAFPGKIYIHENVMCQGMFGVFQQNTMICRKDLELYKLLGVAGICYEAFEPGYWMFEKHFETLAGLNGKYVESELEKVLPLSNMRFFCDDLKFPLEKYIENSIILKNISYFRRFLAGLDFDLYCEYIDFVIANKDKLDFIMIGYNLSRTGLLQKNIRFNGLSDLGKEMLSCRKLWDFMEKIPDGTVPVELCTELIMEMRSKVENF